VFEPKISDTDMAQAMIDFMTHLSVTELGQEPNVFERYGKRLIVSGMLFLWRFAWHSQSALEAD
jgi:hypothetical protein